MCLLFTWSLNNNDEKLPNLESSLEPQSAGQENMTVPAWRSASALSLSPLFLPALHRPLE